MVGERGLFLLVILSASLTAGCVEFPPAQGGGEPFDGDGTFTIHASPPPAPFEQATTEAAVAEAVAYWSTQGHPIELVQAAAEANRPISFAKLGDGHGIGRSCVSDDTDIRCQIEIGLGDGSCNDVWTAFDEETIQAIAVHELGHAMGLGHVDDPSDPMHETLLTSYAGYCELTAGTVRIDSGDWWGLRFEAPDERVAAFDVQVSGSNTVEACLIEDEHWSGLASGSTPSLVCDEGSAQVDGEARVDPGVYRLAIQCKEHSGACPVAYSLGWA